MPDAPGVPVWDGETRDSRVGLDWRAPQTNGAPIDYYEVQDQRGHTQRCQGTSCDITGLENRTTYKFRVRAHNPIGLSEWSGWSAGVMPDKPIDMNGRIELVARGDGTLTIDWKRVVLKGGGEAIYIGAFVRGRDPGGLHVRGDVHRVGQPPEVHVPRSGCATPSPSARA